MLAPNCPEALAIRYAANLLGAAASFLPALATGGHQGALLARIQPALLVVFAETAHLVAEAPPMRVVSVGIGSASSQLDKLANACSDRSLPIGAQANDLAVIVSSGGATGMPKCSRRSFAAYSAMVKAPRAEDRRQLVNGALAYISQVLVDSNLISGGTVVLEGRYDPAETLATIESERVTDLLLVEPQLFETMDHPDACRRNLSSLRSIAHVGGSAPPVLRQRAIKRFGPVLSHIYGASEMGVVSVSDPSGYGKNVNMETSAGRIVDAVEVRIRCTEGSLAGTGQVGNIEVRSRFVSQGYYNQPDEQSGKFRDGGCLTGDVGFLDEGGCLHVLGRASDVAVVEGMITGPTAIEEILCLMPEVRYAAVFAPKDTAAGKTWIALIEPWAATQVDVARCSNTLEAALGRAIANRVRIVPVARVPQTEQGKVDRTR